MRVTFDTNILARASFSLHGPARRAFDEASLPPHAVVLSEPILAAVHRVLHYPRLAALHGMDDAAIDTAVADLRTIADMVVPPAPTSVVPTDPTDDLNIATAITGKADVLCTRDRHLRQPSVVAYCQQHGIRVLTDLELLQALQPLNP